MLPNTLPLILLTLAQTVATTDKCTYIEYRGRKATQKNNECPETSICKKNFSISVINLPPYSTSEIFETILQRCCGPCTSITHTKMYVNVTEAHLHRDNSPDFILPFLGKSNAVELYSYRFIPFIDVPSMYYISPKPKSRTAYVISSCLELYPFLVIYFLLTIISGFIIWILETRHNSEHFPSPFLSGVFEGFWFSFISMTTVGYGDKLPRSVCAKLYSIFWILAGIIMFGFLTSQFTAELMVAMQPREDCMTGANVGVLKYRDYDAAVVVSQGGIVKETDGWDFNSDVQKLVRMLRNGEINGFVLDKYTASYAKGYLLWLKDNTLSWSRNNNNKTTKTSEEVLKDIDFYFTSTRRSLKMYEDQKLAYGVLVNSSRDYDYFNNAVRDNRFSLEIAVESEMNIEMVTVSSHSSRMYFESALQVIGAVLGMICLFGIGYEMYSRKSRVAKETLLNQARNCKTRILRESRNGNSFQSFIKIVF